MSKFLANEWNKATEEMDSFFEGMDAKIKNAQDNTMDEQIWTTPNQRRLIAAAPELLAALEAITERAEDVSAKIPVENRSEGVSQAAHVRHMASHLAQHAKIARAVLTKVKNA